MKKLLVILLSIATISVWGQVKPTVSVLGDSYSTFEGFIPEGNETWYMSATLNRTDVDRVEQTWWWQVIKEGGYKLGINNSWSGATVCNTGYNDKDYTHESFVTRSLNLGCPDIILICGATNDSWAGVALGNYQYDKWRRGDLFFFRPAMAKMLDNIRLHYPNAEVYFILNTELKPEINESVDQICGHYGVPVIKLHNIDKVNGHPTIKGMKDMASQVLKTIRK